MKKIFLFIILVLNFSLFAEDGEAIKYSAMLVSDSTGNILVETNSNIEHPLASLTKMMTCLLVLEKIEEGKISLKDETKISYKASIIKGSRIDLRRGQSISVEELLKGVIVYSGNNAAYALAELIGGTEEDFVVLMNEKAQKLDMKSTIYYTATGLPSDMTGKKMDISTAQDLLKLAIEILNYKRYLEYSEMKNVTIKGKKYKNRNNLINTDLNVDGLKTGHHDEAQYNIVISSYDKDIRYISVVLGAIDEKTRDIEAEKILREIYLKYKKIKIASKGDYAVKVPVKNSIKKKVKLYISKDIEIIEKEDTKIEKTVYIPKEITAPLKKGEKIGIYSIKKNDKLILEIPLILNEDIEKISFLRKILRVISFGKI